MSQNEKQIVRMSVLYELRLKLTNGNKKEYTIDELTELLDKLAMAKEQEA